MTPKVRFSRSQKIREIAKVYTRERLYLKVTDLSIFIGQIRNKLYRVDLEALDYLTLNFHRFKGFGNY